MMNVIKLKRLNGTEVVINAEQIELVEATPDTVVTLLNGHKMVVKDSIDDVIDKVISYKRKIYREFQKE